MPFPEPETALASTIGCEDEAEVIREKIVRLRACYTPPTTFQSLTRRLNNLHQDSTTYEAGEFSDEVRRGDPANLLHDPSRKKSAWSVRRFWV